MSGHKPLGRLSKLISYVSAYYFTLGVLLAIVASLLTWFICYSPSETGYYDRTLEEQLFLRIFLSKEHIFTVMSFEISLACIAILTAFFWQQLAHLLRFVSEGTFLAPATIVVLKRLSRALLILFGVGVLNNAMALRINESMIQIVKDHAVKMPDVIQLVEKWTLFLGQEWFKYLFPQFDGSTNLFLAVICFFAHKALQNALNMRVSLDALKEESSLTI